MEKRYIKSLYTNVEKTDTRGEKTYVKKKYIRKKDILRSENIL